MDLKELNYIVTIAEEGSISRAAEKLYMAQSSLSQFLQLYEAELGTPLFMRTSRGVRATASGSVFIAHARQILLHYRRAQSELWDIEELHGGQIELGISTFRGTYLLPKVLKRFHEIYPKIHVEITEMDSVDLEGRILEGLLDIALIALPAARLKNNIDFLMKDEIHIVASKDHPVMKYVHRNGPSSGPAGTVTSVSGASASGASVSGNSKYGTSAACLSLEDAAPFEFILGPPQTVLGSIARREFRRYGLEPFARNTNFTAPFAAAMAREGVALALTYHSCIVPDENVEYLRIGKEGVFLDLALTYPTGEYRSKAAVALGKLFHEIYR